jgi:chromosome partitioning protein
MPVIAVVNFKGGSGKSTLATHLAGYAASIGLPVMLGDVDLQKSTVVWLKRRAREPVAQTRPILSWVADGGKVLRPPKGVNHVVLDTPGGMRGIDLARAVMSADAVLMPLCDSAFDRDSAAQCWAALQALPRVASGRCKVAAVGMRIDGRTKSDAALRDWAQALGLPLVGTIRDTQSYVRCIERGLTVFDLPASRTEADRAQWAPILDWLEPLWLSGELATPSQAGALEAVAPVATPPQRVTPLKPAPAVNQALAAALHAPSSRRRGWLVQAWEAARSALLPRRLGKATR